MVCDVCKWVGVCVCLHVYVFTCVLCMCACAISLSVYLCVVVCNMCVFERVCMRVYLSLPLFVNVYLCVAGVGVQPTRTRSCDPNLVTKNSDSLQSVDTLGELKTRHTNRFEDPDQCVQC